MDDRDEIDPVAEADEVREIRARRDAALTPGERLERLDRLCKQLAELRMTGDR